MSTIYDVAEMAGVSAMTVSRVLNNPDKVSPGARKRIEHAIEVLGYKTNQAARSLVAKSTGIVKIVHSEKQAAQDPYFMTLFAGMSAVLSENTIAQLIIHDFAPHLKCDGMIVMGLKKGQALDLNIGANSVPVVLFGKGFDDVDWVDVDNMAGSYSATKHLLELGHQEIAFFSFQIEEPYIQEREAGYRQAMAEFGIEVQPSWVVSDMTNDSASAKKSALRVLRTADFSAIVCASDIVALGVTQAAKELNIDVPGALSVTGFDGVGVDLMSDPRLTTAKQPVFEVGRRLAEILVQRIKSRQANYQVTHELMQTKLIVRDSTAKK